MLRPIISTLKLAAENASWAVHVESCLLTAWGAPRIGPKAFEAPVSALRAGDLFIWVGERGDIVPWKAISDRGVKTVQYQTEHYGTRNFRCNATSDELWFF